MKFYINSIVPGIKTTMFGEIKSCVLDINDRLLMRKFIFFFRLGLGSNLQSQSYKNIFLQVAFYVSTWPFFAAKFTL